MLFCKDTPIIVFQCFRRSLPTPEAIAGDLAAVVPLCAHLFPGNQAFRGADGSVASKQRSGVAADGVSMLGAPGALAACGGLRSKWVRFSNLGPAK